MMRRVHGVRTSRMATGLPCRELILRSTLLLGALLAVAMADAAEPPETVGPEVPTAPVRLDGRTLLTVRGVSSLPAAERAALIEERVRAVARDRTIDPDSVTVVQGPLGHEIRAGGRPLLTVIAADAELESISAETLAA